MNIKGRTITLSIVTENQKSKTKAEKLAGIISNDLKIVNSARIENYSKSENSYKLDFEFRLENDGNSIYESLEKADRLCTPWIVWFNREENEVELVFNKTTESKFRRLEYNVISWCTWTVDK